MIILDTNVISALMQLTPDPHIVAWINEQPLESFGTTSVTLYEIAYGLNIMPDGKRRRQLKESFNTVLQQGMQGTILKFDPAAAYETATISAKLREEGRTVDIRDAMIAGITAAQQGTLVTRNTKHFADTVIPLINPWEQEPA